MLKTSTSWKSVWIYLKSQNKFWNLKIWFKSENKLFCLKIYFKCGPRRVVQCACIQPYHVINLNTRTRHRSVGSMFEIIFSDRIILFQIEIKFEISDGFSWDKTFGHMSWKSVWIYLKCQIKFWYLKIWFKPEKVLSCLKIYFKHIPCGVVPASCHVCEFNPIMW